MDAEWFAERAALRCLMQAHPDGTQAELAATLGRSRSWGAIWLPRLKEAEPADLTVLHARSCARHTPPSPMPRALVERLLAIRDDPPDHLRRVPGPKARLSFLPRERQAQALGVPLPRSTRTIWKVLRAHRRLAQAPPRRRQPLVRPAPLEVVQLDWRRTRAVGLRTPTATRTRWWRSSILSRRARLSCSGRKCRPIITRKPPSLRSSPSSSRLGDQST